VSSLRALQEELKNLLFIHEPPRRASRWWPEGIPERLSVYENDVHLNWTDALDHDFLLTKKQFGAEDWTSLQRRYFEKYPPRHWELNTAVAPFPKFLSAQKVKPYVKELADYEWNDLQVFIDRAFVRPEAGVTNPTARLSVYRHQIFDWVQAGAAPAFPPAQKPEVLVFYRDAKNVCHIQEADPLMLLMMEHFRKNGASLADLEPLRRRLLPDNRVPLAAVVENLKKSGLLLL